MLLAGEQRREVVGEDLVGLGDGEHLDLHVVVEQVATQNLCVADLLLDLDHVPVGKALEAAVLVVVRKGEVEIGRVEFLVDLLVHELGDVLVKCHGGSLPKTLLPTWCVYPSLCASVPWGAICYTGQSLARVAEWQTRRSQKPLRQLVWVRVPPRAPLNAQGGEKACSSRRLF